jgi:hypothetical protein
MNFLFFQFFLFFGISAFICSHPPNYKMPKIDFLLIVDKSRDSMDKYISSVKGELLWFIEEMLGSGNLRYEEQMFDNRIGLMTIGGMPELLVPFTVLNKIYIRMI